jgi:hypothetical protein
MAFMDFLPQFGDNTDQSVTDPTLQAINLKRKLALADSLRNTPTPQGQMIGNRYVAPSWTQYLAGAVSQGLAGQKEKEAMKEYGDYQKAQQDKMANALKTLSGAFEPKIISNTTMQTQDVPLTEGMNVGTSPFSTTDQVAKVAPKFDTNAPAPQNMSGTTTQATPVTTTSTVQPTLSDIEKAFGQYATEVNDPKMLASLLSGRYEKMVKANEPVKLGAGESVFSSTGTKIFGNPKEETPGTLEKNYNFAKSQGYLGSIQDFQRIATNYISPYQKAQLKLEQEKTDPYHIFSNTSPANISKQTKPLENKQGWKLHTDAQGNQAYVSPDGKQFEEIQ